MSLIDPTIIGGMFGLSVVAFSIYLATKGSVSSFKAKKQQKKSARLDDPYAEDNEIMERVEKYQAKKVASESHSNELNDYKPAKKTSRQTEFSTSSSSSCHGSSGSSSSDSGGSCGGGGGGCD